MRIFSYSLIMLLLIGVFGSVTPVFADADSGVLVVRTSEDDGIDLLREFDSNPQKLLLENVYRISVPSVKRALSVLSASSKISYVHEDFLLQAETVATDSWFVTDGNDLQKQWYLPKISAPKAWNKTTGSIETVVAIVDTGIDGRHRDLKSGQVGPGYASYCQAHSIDASNPCLIRVEGKITGGINSDDNGHGTIVAGLIGATANNGSGIVGVNWNVKLMPIKVLDSDGTGFASDIASGITWAVDNGAKIVNLSFGGSDDSNAPILQEAIDYAYENNVLVVAAAGNDAAITGGDLDTNLVYPVCSDGGKNKVIGVAALDINDKKAKFSNYGSVCVDISAPGTGVFIDNQTKQGILSTIYDPSRPGEHDLYTFASGTSLAAPLVSGVAALILDVFPGLDVPGLQEKLLASVDNINSENTTGCQEASCVGQIGAGRVNAAKAVSGAEVNILSGTLVKGTDNSQVYLIDLGVKRPVSDFVLAQRFSQTQVVDKTPAELSLIPTAAAIPPVDGTLIKEYTAPTVYLIEDSKRKALSYLAFISRNFSFDKVVNMSASEILSYPQGNDAGVIDELLMKTADNPAVYVWAENELKLLSYFVFKQRFSDKKIAVVSEEQLASFSKNPEGNLYPPYNGTLLKGQNNPTVYLVEGSELHPLTLDAFINRKFQFKDIQMVSDGEIVQYKIGNVYYH